MNDNQNNLYNYSANINLVNFIKEKNDENNIGQANSESIKKNEFLLELANILENKLKTNIRLHQKGFEIYKEKLLSEKNLILNSINKDIKDLTINQLIDLLTNMKQKEKNEKEKNNFTLGQNTNNNNVNINRDAIERMNQIFSEFSNNNNKDIINILPCNNIGINNKNKNNYKSNFDPRIMIHSPSPILTKKYESKIIEENKNVNNQINFYEDQKIVNN